MYPIFLRQVVAPGQKEFLGPVDLRLQADDLDIPELLAGLFRVLAVLDHYVPAAVRLHLLPD